MKPVTIESHLIDSDAESQEFYWWAAINLVDGHFEYEARESLRLKDPVIAVVWPMKQPAEWWFDVDGVQDWRRTPAEARLAAEQEWDRQSIVRARDYRDAVRGVDRG